MLFNIFVIISFIYMVHEVCNAVTSIGADVLFCMHYAIQVSHMSVVISDRSLDKCTHKVSSRRMV